MYEKFYHLHAKPFSIVPNPDMLFLSEKHQDALTYLEYGLTEKVGFILLTGDIGTGKTTLIRHLLAQGDAEIEVAEIYNTSVSPDELVFQILKEFGLAVPANDKFKSLEVLNRFLIKKYAQGEQALLIVDEAQNLSNEGMEEIRLLSNLQTDDQVLLQILLVGQPELKMRLRNPSLRQLSQRIGVSYHLKALEKQEAVDYIVYRLEKVGGQASLFTPEAMELAFHASRGIPRTINLICDAAMVYGFADGVNTINVEMINAVIDERDGIGIDLNAVPAANDGSGNNGHRNGHAYLKQLQAIETSFKKLLVYAAKQAKSQQAYMEAFKKDIEENLAGLLKAERRRNDKLARRYKRLKQHYQALKAEAPPEFITPEGEGSVVREKEEKKGWLKKK